MSDEQDPEIGYHQLRPVTRDLIDAICTDVWPRQAAIVDFGLHTVEHFEAIYYAFRHGEITKGELESALGNGPRLTELVSRAAHNPHKGIVFTTDWDNLPIEPEEPDQGQEVRHQAKVYNLGRERAKRMNREHAEERRCGKDRDRGPEPEW